MTSREALSHATETEAYVCNAEAAAALVSWLQENTGGRSTTVIADGNTMEAAGSDLIRTLRSAGIPLSDPLVFPPQPELSPDYTRVGLIRDALGAGEGTGVPDDTPVGPDAPPPGADFRFPLAVGSGVVNDLVKRAAGEAGLPYAVYATAASVDGYTAYGAALQVDGFKRTIPCPAPRGVFADPAVLAAAPNRLTASGFGDLSAKYTVFADWYAADLTGDEALDSLCHEMVRVGLEDRLSRPAGVAAGETDAITAQFDGLTFPGFAMQIYRDSRPGSGSEHTLAHVWEMDHLTYHGVPVLHGAKAGLGTLIAAALWEILLEGPAPTTKEHLTRLTDISSSADRRKEVRSLFPDLPESGLSTLAATACSKLPTPEDAQRRGAALNSGWEGLRRRIRESVPPYPALRDSLRTAGAPVTLAEVGLDRDTLPATIRRAQTIRKRYGLLDILYETARWDETIAKLIDSPVYLR